MDRDNLAEKIQFLVNQNSEILNKISDYKSETMAAISDLSDKYGN